MRPKRPLERGFLSERSDGPASGKKKPRFDSRNPSTLAADAREDNAILDVDEIGRAQRQAKRNAVNIDGYDSDSSEGNFDVRADEKARRAKASAATESAAADEADMFAELDDNDLGDAGEDEDDVGRGIDAGTRAKKSVTFLEDDQIEGQVADSKSGGHVSVDFTSKRSKDMTRSDNNSSSSSSSESGGDEERDRVDSDMDDELGAGSKKKHAPKLDAFNMKQENEEGRFDDQGNYVRKANDPDAVYDSWLEGLSKKDMKKAKAAEEMREQTRRSRALADDELLTSDILATLINHLNHGETVREALVRLGTVGKKAKQKPKWHKAKRKLHANDGGTGGQDGEEENMDLDSAQKAAVDSAEESRRQAVEAITGAADQLLTRGQTNIYEQERELLVRQYKRDTGDDWIDAPAEQMVGDEAAAQMWEYRWSDARDAGTRHGPYDAQKMAAWSDAGYFGDGVEFRKVGESGWERLVHFL